MDRRTYGQTDGRIERTDRRMNRRPVRWTDRRMELSWTVGRMGGRNDEQGDGRTEGRTGGLADERMDGMTDRRINGRTDRPTD